MAIRSIFHWFSTLFSACLPAQECKIQNIKIFYGFLTHAHTQEDKQTHRQTSTLKSCRNLKQERAQKQKQIKHKMRHFHSLLCAVNVYVYAPVSMQQMQNACNNHAASKCCRLTLVVVQLETANID